MTAPATSTSTWHCEVCEEDVPTDDLIAHVRALHPNRFDPVEKWSDGTAVVVDTTRPEWMP